MAYTQGVLNLLDVLDDAFGLLVGCHEVCGIELVFRRVVYFSCELYGSQKVVKPFNCISLSVSVGDRRNVQIYDPSLALFSF